MTRMTLADVEAHQRIHGRGDSLHVERSKHRPRPNTALISQAAAKKSNRSKFKNLRCIAADGRRFASVLEKNYYEGLLLRWKAGDVVWFTCQMPFWLEGGVKYVLDFFVVEKDGFRLIDTTGYKTQTKTNKLKQLESRYGLKVEIVREA